MDARSAFKALENCLIFDEVPSLRLRVFEGEPWFRRPPFSLLAELKKTEQSPAHHPEGNVWNHTLLVVDEAAKRRSYSSDVRAFMWAALLHDIGKPSATKVRKGRITAYGHDAAGAGLARAFLSEFTDDAAFIGAVVALVRYHMHTFYVSKELPFQDIPGLLRDANANDAALLGYCDRLGRRGADAEAEKANIALFLKKLNEDADKPWL